MGNFSCCMGLLLRFLTALTPRADSTYDRLSTGMDVDVLDGDALLTLAAVTVEGFGQSRVGPAELFVPDSGSRADLQRSARQASHASSIPWRRYGSRSAG